MRTKQQPSEPKGHPESKLPNQHDFSGKTLFVGIDIHKKRWQVAIYFHGLILSNASIEGTSDKLITYLQKHYPGAQFSCVYESCAWGYTLCRSLQKADINCMIVNPADIPGTDSGSAAARPTLWTPASWPSAWQQVYSVPLKCLLKNCKNSAV